MEKFYINDVVQLLHEKEKGIVTAVQGEVVTVYINSMEMEIEEHASALLLIERYIKEEIPLKVVDKKTENLEKDLLTSIEQLKESGLGSKTGQKTKVVKKTPRLKIDLHWDVLQESYPKVTETDIDEIFRIQKLEFESFYMESVVDQVQMVNVVHGIGSGKLREYIHAYLRKRKEQCAFEELNPGLTQIVFLLK